MPDRLSRFTRLASLLSLASLASRGSCHAGDDESLGDGFHEVPEDEVARDPSAPPAPIDFKPLLGAGRQVVSWLCDVARSRTTDPLDHTAIDRVDGAAQALLTGTPNAGGTSEEDVLTVLGLLVTAFETDLGLRGLADLAGVLYDVAGQVAPSLATYDPILMALRAATVNHAPEAAEGTARRARVVLPVIVRRRARIAYGDDDAGAAAAVLIVR
ncbi:MAG TPA: hypothetical protein VHE35_07485 [Kofleriaceae bacterium]|nr:hypothetical protein [Kofleriaceae bacterium]